jgi:hypothetical protein
VCLAKIPSGLLKRLTHAPERAWHAVREGTRYGSYWAQRNPKFPSYDRDGIVYRKERLDRDFEIASRVELDTPGAGVFENIHGLCAKVWLFGCAGVRSIVKDGETVEVRARTFTSKFPLKPIQA